MISLTRRLFLAGLALAVVAPSFAADLPKVIRLGSPLVGTGNRPVGAGNSFANAQIKGLLEQEFQKDGIKIEWNNVRGAGPALNEAVANGLLDVFWEGDLPAIIGRSGGLKTKLLLANGRSSNLYLAVPPDSPAKSLEDLKGKKVAVFKGTAVQLAAGKIYAKHGLSERDFKSINMDTATGNAALTTKDVDAVWSSSAILTLEDRGVARVVYSTRKDPQAQSLNMQGYVFTTEEFEKKYPEVVQRIVNVLVKEAAWASDDKNRNALFQLWAKSGVPFSAFKRDAEGISQKEVQSPLLDDYFVALVRNSVTEAQKLKLLRGNLDVPAWLEPKYLNNALKSQGLESYWKPLDAKGSAKL